MYLIEFSVRGLFLIISCYGYLQYLSKKMRPEFAVGWLFSAIGSLMFLAGMQNLLQEMTAVIFLGGICLAVQSAKSKESPFSLLTPGLVFFLIGCAGLLVTLYGGKFIQYDNFSHWGIATKALAVYDRFPNASNVNVEFTSYPLGTASFIYYITKILGISPEWLQCYGQAILILGMSVSLFAFAASASSVLLSGCVCLFLLVSNIPLFSLCVDTLLPLIAFAGIAFCIYHRDSLEEKLFYVLPYSVFLVSVKSSGILFAVFIFIYMFCCLQKTKARLWPLVVGLLITAAVVFFWNKHVKMVYDNGMMGRHSLSLSYAQSIFQQKTWDDISLTLSSFLRETISLSNRGFQVIAFCFALWLIWGSLCKQDAALLKQICLASLLFYVIYQVGLLGMYIFNMPLDPDPIPSFARYHKTIIMYLVGLAAIPTIDVMEQMRKENRIRIPELFLAALAIAGAFLVCKPAFSWLGRQNIDGTVRQHFDTLIEEYGIETQMRYMILTDENHEDSGYLSCMAAYLLDPEDYVVCAPSQVGSHLELYTLKYYDYIIVFDENEESRQLLKDRFGEYHQVIATAESNIS